MQAISVEAPTSHNKINKLCTAIEVHELRVYSSAGEKQPQLEVLVRKPVSEAFTNISLSFHGS